MAVKKAPPIIEVVFVGPGLYPEKIPVASLASALSAVQRLALGEPVLDEDDDEIDERDDATKSDQDRSLQLVAVKRGSAVFQMSGSAGKEAVQRLRVVGSFLANPDQLGENDYVLNPIERLSASARSLDCQIVLREPGRDGDVLAMILPNTYESFAKSLLIKGQTSFTGKIQRVGGVTARKCGLRVPFQHRLLICKVASDAAARKMGEHLYQEVVVQGEASWLKTSWRIISFVVHDVSVLQHGPLQAAFDALRKAGGDQWDRITDPDAYLTEVTGQL